MAMKNAVLNYDTFGAFASGLCLIHCVATPLIFVAHAGITAHDHHHGSPGWWGTMDIVFLVVSLVAVIWAALKSSNTWVRLLMLASWAGLAFVIFNEKLGWVHLPEEMIYPPSVALVFLHIYNRRFCTCADENCDSERENCTVPQPKNP